jgi:hypothetical protein
VIATVVIRLSGDLRGHCLSDRGHRLSDDDRHVNCTLRSVQHMQPFATDAFILNRDEPFW